MVVLKFIAWMERAPAPARANAVGPLVRTYFRDDLTDADREVLDATLTTLLDDPAVEVRRALAEALARHEAAPRHLIVTLAQDLPSVAEPVYNWSPCLLDDELVEAIGSAGVRIQVAIARRPWVSAAVCRVIAAEAEIDAVLSLAENGGSDIENDTFSVMVERFPGDPDLREALFARQDLPIVARQSLMAGLGARLGDLVVSRSWMTSRRAEAVVREACDKATVELAAVADETDLRDLVEHLRQSGQLTTALLVRSMCQGHVRFFEAAVALLAGLPPSRVYPILAEGRQAGVQALFRKAGLPERSHAAFFAALEVWREQDVAQGGGHAAEPADNAIRRARRTRRMVERILSRYQKDRSAEVDDLTAMLRRLVAEAARDAARAYVEAARKDASALGSALEVAA